jgi:hypothetical protein
MTVRFSKIVPVAFRNLVETKERRKESDMLLLGICQALTTNIEYS